MRPLLLALMVISALLIGWAGLRVRREFRLDAILLCGTAILLLGHVLLWQITPSALVLATPEPLRPLTALISMLFGPSWVYLAAIVLAIRFFITPVRGWPRAAFLIAAIAMLSPMLFLFLIVPIAFSVS